jgi:predicted secreted protein
MNLNNNPVDVTNADSNGFREIFAQGGSQQMDLTCEGLVNASDPFRRLRRYALVREELTVQYRSFSNEAWEANVVPMDYVLTGAYNDVETFRITLNSSGPITVKIDDTSYQANTNDEVNVAEDDTEGFLPGDQAPT